MTSEPNDLPIARRVDRVPFALEVMVRCPGGHRFRVRAFDASPTGCKIEFIERPKLGERVWVTFDGLNPVEASVRWLDGPYGGLEFDRPLHPAVFDRIAR